METQLLISKKMEIDTIFERYPSKAQKLSQIMSNAGLDCVGCSGSSFESIEQGMASHGSSEIEINKLVNDLNRVLEEKEEAREDICFSAVAAEKCNGFRKNPNQMLKISLDRGSCGWSYIFRFTEKKGEDELIVEDKGIKLILNKGDVGKLKGAVIDYVDGLQGAGFKVLNPNVKGTCGCGKSVAL